MILNKTNRVATLITIAVAEITMVSVLNNPFPSISVIAYKLTDMTM
ncbi:hypothetical protein B4120_4162 [Bacillus cereus]|nr:hypothetical protein B4120_4162 [Bacillus cereus]